MLKHLLLLVILLLPTSLKADLCSDMDEVLIDIHELSKEGSVIEMKGAAGKTTVDAIQTMYSQCKMETYPLATLKLKHNFFKIYYDKGMLIYEIDVYPIDSNIKEISKKDITNALGFVDHEVREGGMDKIGYNAGENKLVFVLSEKSQKLQYYYVYNYRAHFNNMCDSCDNDRRW